MFHFFSIFFLSNQKIAKMRTFTPQNNPTDENPTPHPNSLSL